MLMRSFYIVLSGLITVLLYVFRGTIVHHLFGQIDAEVMAATNTYYQIVMASIPGIAIYNAGAMDNTCINNLLDIPLSSIP